MINALTIDVEDYFQVAAFDRNIDRANWSSMASRVEANTEKFLSITDEKGVKATFFVLGWIAERHPNLIKKIAAHGHEIASHGFSHKLIYSQDRQEFRQETAHTKSLLEDLAQQPVAGYRAASYSITQDSIWALDIIEELGFSYDSSIYPVRHDRYGLQGGPHSPYKIAINEGRELIEFPITTVDLLGYKLPVGGGGYFRIYPFALTKRLLQRRQRQIDSPFVFYLHPWELDPDQPKVAGASALSKFRHYHNLAKVEGRLQILLDMFEFGTMASVLAGLQDLPSHRYT